MDEISIKVKSETADFFRILLWHSWKRLAISLALVLFVSFSFIFYAANVKPKDPTNDERWILYIPVLVLPLLVIGSAYIGMRRRAKKLAATVSRETEITFSDAGVDSSNVMFTSNVSWGQYKKIVETANDFVFFPQDNIFFGVPKRCFESEGQIEEFKTLLKEHLGNRARVKF